MSTEPTLPHPLPTFDSRVRGGLFGALVGDALGVPVEFCERVERDLDPVTDMRAWGRHHQPAGTWSDDGSLLLCTAEGVQSGFLPAKLALLYVKWMTSGYWAARDEVFDIGGATRAALCRLQDGVSLGQAGADGEWQNGNGSLMRILPIALRFHRRPAEELTDIAMDASAITHSHIRSQFACAFYCQMVAALLRDLSPREAYQFAIREIAPLVEPYPRERIAFERLLTGRIDELDRSEVFGSGYVIHSLEASIWCVLREPSFRTAVLAAVNLGDDTDTTGCVTGGLAGAIHGYEAIPPEWPATLLKRDELEQLSQTFLRSCHDA
jgi:ADP-ribosyl-[dinitrogen reductase] hydrolase